MFKQFFYRRRLKRILKNQKLNRRQRCLALLELLKGEKLPDKEFDSRLNLKISVLYKNITEYSRRLKEINYQIDRKSLISSDMLSATPIVVILDSFFTDENNYYVEVNQSFDNFKQECTRLLLQIAESDSAEYGYFEHTARVLRNVLLNIEDVLVKISVSLQE